jgi:hypothetical protein
MHNSGRVGLLSEIERVEVEAYEEEKDGNVYGLVLVGLEREGEGS